MPEIRSRGDAIRVNAAGSVARVQLQVPDFDGPVQAEVSQDGLAGLDLKAGDTVYVAPRKVRVFVPDYSI